MSDYNDKFIYRHELKYIMPQTSKEVMIQRLRIFFIRIQITKKVKTAECFLFA